MRVGILTYHSSLNFGAALQAYALQVACRELGAMPELINYHNPAIAARRGVPSVAHGKSMKSLAQWVKALASRRMIVSKVKTFEQFYSQHLNVSDRLVTNYADLVENPAVYDRYIIGSDQVWNYEINGRDEAYFATFVKDRSRVATYAASFGLDEIPESHIEFYRSGVSSIPNLSVREDLGAELAFRLTGTRPLVHPDPVFLLEPAAWKRLAEARRSTSIKGALVTYFLASNTQVASQDIIRNSSLRRLKHLKLAGGIQPKQMISPRYSVRYSRGPIDFVQAIIDAEYVLTDSFHATALAIILDKPFGVILRGEPGKDARILTLLNRLGFEDRVVSSASEIELKNSAGTEFSSPTLRGMRNDGMEYLAGLLGYRSSDG